MWCLISGGEPLLRPDFPEIYLALKRHGLLVSVFTNACLVTEEHVELFRRYPPRDIEVSVYGATRETYEAGDAASRLLRRLLAAASTCCSRAASRCGSRPWPCAPTCTSCTAIAAFCRARTKDYYRFDPLLHLRFDGDPTATRRSAPSA